jgi:outer membrane protein assembly factor BamB
MTESKSKTTLILITVSLLLVVSAAAIAAYSDPTQTDEKIVDWKYSTSTDTIYPLGSLTVTQERVYFIATPSPDLDDSSEGVPLYIYSLNSSSDEEAWRFNISGSESERSNHIRQILTLRDGTVYASGVDGRIYAVDADSGTEEWNMSIRHWVNSDVVPFSTVSDGVAYVAGVNAEVRALDATTGRLLWNSSIKNGTSLTGTISDVFLTGTVSGDTVYIAGEVEEDREDSVKGSRGILVALDASSGERIWSYNTSDSTPRVYSPVVGDGLVYIRDRSNWNRGPGVVRAINVTTGEQEWEFYSDKPSSDITYGSVAVSDGKVYYPGDGIYALDARTGEVIWKYDLPESIPLIETTPVVKRGTVYVGVDVIHGESPHVFALDAESGELEWSVTSGKEAMTGESPAIMNNRLYIGGTNGTVYSLNLTALRESDKKSHVIDGGYGGGGMFSDGLIP